MAAGTPLTAGGVTLSAAQAGLGDASPVPGEKAAE